MIWEFVESSVAAYKVCQERIAAVDAALAKALSETAQQPEGGGGTEG
ncbi:exodeoxyribonuclease VII small subunit [Ramlibacter sp. MMS24-I3-19]